MAFRSVSYQTSGSVTAATSVSVGAALAGDLHGMVSLGTTTTQFPFSDGAPVVTAVGAANSANSSCASAYGLATSDAQVFNVSGGSAARIQATTFRAARKLYAPAQSTFTSSTITIPALKGLRHGGMFWAFAITETASITVSADNSGLTARVASSTTHSRYSWSGGPSYAGGTVTMSGSAEWWLVIGIAI